MYCLKRYFVYVFVLYMYLYFICICIVVCTQLLVNSRVEDECYPTYISLIDKCMHHEAFTVKQRKLLQEWRSQVLQRNNSRMITGRQEQRIPLHRPTGCVLSYNLCAPLRMEQIAGGAEFLASAWESPCKSSIAPIHIYKALVPTFSHLILEESTSAPLAAVLHTLSLLLSPRNMSPSSTDQGLMMCILLPANVV